MDKKKKQSTQQNKYERGEFEKLEIQSNVFMEEYKHGYFLHSEGYVIAKFFHEGKVLGMGHYEYIGDPVEHCKNFLTDFDVEANISVRRSMGVEKLGSG